MNLDRFHALDIILLCGIYGSGKTEFAVKYFKGTDRVRVSRSEIRKFIYEMTNFGEKWDAGSFNENDDYVTKHIERKILEHYLHNSQKVLVINTFATKKSRKRFIKLAKSLNKKIGLIFLNRPMDECVKRNAESSNPVPETVIRTLFTRLEIPEKSEGFNEAGVINLHE